MRRLIDSGNKLWHSSHRTRVMQAMISDIWCMKVFNGTSIIIDDRSAFCLLALTLARQQVVHFIYAPWAQETSRPPINYLEVLSLEIAARRWSHLWANKLVYVQCDNITAYTIINKASSKNQVVMDSLRRVFWLSALYNFRINTIFYPGQYNVLAGAVSRFHENNGAQSLRSVMSVNVFIIAGNSETTEVELDHATQFFYSNVNAANTKRAYTSHRKSYINFC